MAMIKWANHYDNNMHKTQHMIGQMQHEMLFPREQENDLLAWQPSFAQIVRHAVRYVLVVTLT